MQIEKLQPENKRNFWHQSLVSILIVINIILHSNGFLHNLSFPQHLLKNLQKTSQTIIYSYLIKTKEEHEAFLKTKRARLFQVMKHNKQLLFTLLT